MSANQITSITQNLECPAFSVANFFQLVDGRLTQEQTKELLDHLTKCQPCKELEKEVRAIFTGNAKQLTRVEQLVFLKNIYSPLWSTENETENLFWDKFLAKNKKRLARLEREIKTLKQTLAQISNNASLAKEVDHAN